jgi:hypothetical protein
MPISALACLIPAWILLGVCRLALLTTPFKRLAPLLGGHLPNCYWLPVLNPRQELRARQISRCVRRAARYTPWESNCFPQAIAARALLGLFRVPYGLFLGVAKDDSSSLKAHAWVTAGRVHVTGGHGFDAYTVVGGFISPHLKS